MVATIVQEARDNNSLEYTRSCQSRSNIEVEFAWLYYNLTEPRPLVPATPEDVRKIYDMVMHGEDIGDDAPDGKLFRKGEEAIYRDASTVVHEGLYPESAITDAMRKMLLLVNSDDVPKLYSAILGHFIFEYIHPFYDGNGRTGRYLLALWLREPLSVLTPLSLSRIVLENKRLKPETCGLGVDPVAQS